MSAVSKQYSNLNVCSFGSLKKKIILDALDLEITFLKPQVLMKDQAMS